MRSAFLAPYISLELGVGATLAHAFPSSWCMRPLYALPHLCHRLRSRVAGRAVPAHPALWCRWPFSHPHPCVLLEYEWLARVVHCSPYLVVHAAHTHASPIYVIACAVGWLGALFLLTSPCGVDGPSCIRIPVYCLSVSGWLAFVHCPPYLVVHAAHTHVSPSPHNHSSLSRALNFPVSGKFGLTAPHLDPGRHTVHSQGRLGRKLLTGPC